MWKNDRLPLRNDGDFALLEDNQQEVLFRVRESGYTKTDELVKSGIDPDATQILDENTLLTGIPSGQPKGTLIQVTFSVDEAGILKLFGSCCGQMIEAEFNITSSMTKEEVEQATNALARVRVSGT